MKVLVGLGLVVTGGGMVIGAAAAGFMGGVAIMLWSQEQKDKDATNKAVARARAQRPRTHHDTATVELPAKGTNLPLDRQSEINNSTPEAPVAITLEEAYAMDLQHVLANIASYRFTFAEGSAT